MELRNVTGAFCANNRIQSRLVTQGVDDIRICARIHRGQICQLPHERDSLLGKVITDRRFGGLQKPAQVATVVEDVQRLFIVCALCRNVAFRLQQLSVQLLNRLLVRIAKRPRVCLGNSILPAYYLYILFADLKVLAGLCQSGRQPGVVTLDRRGLRPRLLCEVAVCDGLGELLRFFGRCRSYGNPDDIGQTDAADFEGTS